MFRAAVHEIRLFQGSTLVKKGAQQRRAPEQTPLLRREAGELVPLAVEGGLLGTTDFLTAH